MAALVPAKTVGERAATVPPFVMAALVAAIHVFLLTDTGNPGPSAGLRVFRGGRFGYP
jgi:hypothetical protein